MAARRLILVLVLLLVISSVAAQLAQPPTTGDETSSGETTTPATTGDRDERPAGRLLRRRVSSGAAEPTEIRARVGDQLELLVSVRTPGSIEIPKLGLIEAADPESPARFDLLLRRADRLEVVGPGRSEAAVIIVGAGEHQGSRAESPDSGPAG
jgi:hypothetical protein